MPSKMDRTASTSKSPHFHKQQPRTIFTSSKLPFYILSICVILYIILQILSLQTPLLPSWYLYHQWQKVSIPSNCTNEDATMTDKLRHAVTFLPLKDLRYSDKALQGHTWFMSSMHDMQEKGEVQYQHFPSQSSKGRLLCLKGNDTHDGSWNSYALAWPEALPFNATLMKGLTFVSYNHYDYGNIWHGLSALMPFVAWHQKNHCAVPPARWILYHWGEVRYRIAPWLDNLMEAAFGASPRIEVFDGVGGDRAVCFEEAVVMRHSEGGMSRERRMEVYDLMRCKARMYCKLTDQQGVHAIGMTLLMRTGPRSFRNESVVIKIFEEECGKVDGCRLRVAYASNLTFCDQVKLMSQTDILISPHGAQLTNMFFMDRNSSVMEFFPKGWLELAGVGQYVFHWIASWSGMKHRGAWRDPNGEVCPYTNDPRRCMSLYKDGLIGYNQTYFAEWARNVLSEVKIRKAEETSHSNIGSSKGCFCT